MKEKILSVLSKMVLILSILLLLVVVICNLWIIFKILFFGMTVGSDLPNTIWFNKLVLHGFDGIRKFYTTYGGLMFTLSAPVVVFSTVYQIVYFKKIQKKKEQK